MRLRQFFRRLTLAGAIAWSSAALAIDIEAPRYPSSPGDQIVLMATAQAVAGTRYCGYSIDENEFAIFRGNLTQQFVRSTLSEGAWREYATKIADAFARSPQKECADLWTSYGKGGLMRNFLRR